MASLIQAKQIKVLLQKNESILFSDPAMDLTDDVTSMLDVAASEAKYSIRVVSQKKEYTLAEIAEFTGSKSCWQ